MNRSFWVSELKIQPLYSNLFSKWGQADILTTRTLLALYKTLYSICCHSALILWMLYWYWSFCIWVNGSVIWWCKSQSPTYRALCQGSARQNHTFDTDRNVSQQKRICKCAELGEVEIILKYNTLKQSKRELSRLTQRIPVLMLLPSFKLARAMRFSATFMVSIYCWMVNHFTYPPSRYVALFTGLWFKVQLAKKHHSCMFITLGFNDASTLRVHRIFTVSS